jgi:hypothetical protein
VVSSTPHGREQSDVFRHVQAVGFSRHFSIKGLHQCTSTVWHAVNIALPDTRKNEPPEGGSVGSWHNRAAILKWKASQVRHGFRCFASNLVRAKKPLI